MGVIRILSEHVANQIAAGEVIERPASVVKELLENALDAGASVIDLHVRGGGADLVEVADDGCGMGRADALLALERHATSKIRTADDLKAIATLGFRGEALPSIASVSSLTLTTSTGDAGGGTRIIVHAGKIEKVDPAPHPRGTTVRVENLFQNAPARRKFLRSAATETARIADLVSAVASAHPAIGFRMRSGGREIASWPAAGSVADRIGQILGADQASALLPVQHQSAGMRLVGLASTPRLQRSTARDLHLFVNGRPVRDRRVQHAVQAAYTTLLPRGRHPVVYLFLEVPAGEVDVNVHPAKAEVRFLRPGGVHDLVHEALVDVLRISRPFYPLGQPPRSLAEPEAPFGASWPPADGTPLSRITLSAAARPKVQTAGASEGTAAANSGAGATALFESSPMAPLAQYRESYILASSPDGLVILDQHAAHERILYERLMKASRAGRVDRQRLLFPLTIEVTPAQRQAFEGSTDTFESLGFMIEVFGGATLKIAEIPALLSVAPLDRLMRDLLDEILEWRRADGVERLRHLIVSTSACHAAVTANQALGGQEMERIVADLLLTDSPMTCPHGRPALLRLDLTRLEREFGRR